MALNSKQLLSPPASSAPLINREIKPQHNTNIQITPHRSNSAINQDAPEALQYKHYCQDLRYLANSQISEGTRAEKACE